jgi:hypothetical protein
LRKRGNTQSEREFEFEIINFRGLLRGHVLYHPIAWNINAEMDSM